MGKLFISSLASVLILTVCAAARARQDEDANRSKTKATTGKTGGGKAGTGKTGSGKTGSGKTGSAGKTAPATSKAPAATAKLTVTVFPKDATVFIEGKPYRSAGDGSMTIPLKPGTYTLTVRKEAYNDHQRTLSLGARADETIHIALLPLPGTLTVSANVPGVRVSISNLGDFDAAGEISIAPGVYEVSVSRVGYQPATSRVTIAPAQKVTLPVRLEILPADELMKQAAENFQQRNYPQAAELARAVLTTKPDMSQAHYLLAYSLFASGDYDGSLQPFAKTLELGGQVAFTVRHRHNYVEMCTGKITLTKDSFAFESTSIFKPDHKFSVPYAKFIELEPRSEISLEFLHTKIRIPKGEGKKGEDEKDLNFYTPEIGSPRDPSCPTCLQRILVIQRLLLYAMKK